MPKRLAIIDYGLGNLHSVSKGIASIAPDWEVALCTSERQLQQADKVVFPGVGAIGACLDGLESLSITHALIEACRTKHTLAICVGYQALFTRVFEFGDRPGLGLLEGEVHSLRYLAQQQGVAGVADEIRVPHSGWNQLHMTPAFEQHAACVGIESQSYMYFVHSYCVAAKEQPFVAAYTNHGVDLVAMVIQDNLIGCQFHPEKSHTAGQQLLRNFMQM